jgi:predicted nucleotidyltransferase
MNASEPNITTNNRACRQLIPKGWLGDGFMGGNQDKGTRYKVQGARGKGARGQGARERDDIYNTYYGIDYSHLGYYHAGMKDQTANLSDALFSKVQRCVLGLIFGNPDRSFYANELFRLAGSGTGAVVRELAKLADSGLVTVSKIGNQKHYQANRAAPIFEELRGIVLKTFGMADVLRQGLLPLSGQISAAFVYGSVAKGTDTARSDIDVMVIGVDLAYPEVYSALMPVEVQLARKINPSIYSNEDVQLKLKKGNTFLTRIMAQPKIFLIGSERDLP